MSKRICVIGAGASGLMAAISAADSGAEVFLVERNDLVGKKLLATGNGRCNFTNSRLDSDLFWGENPSFVKKPISNFGVDETLEFFESIGILSKDKNGYVYPRSLQAESIRKALENKIINNPKIKLYTNQKVVSLEKNNGEFYINLVSSIDSKKERIISDRIIVATGGKANPSSGSDGFFEVLKPLGIKFNNPLPALVPLVSKDKFLKGLSGVRSEVSIDFYADNEKVYQRSGEIQITDFGISGIVVFDGSGRLAKALDENKKCHVVVDFMPEISLLDFQEYLKNRQTCNLPLLDSVLNSKLVKAFMTSFDGNVDNLAKDIKCKKINVTGTKDFDRAQVTTGGILTKFINDETMEYKDIPGLYFCGEIIDIDGPCGGYNLQWAWTSGYLAGKHTAND